MKVEFKKGWITLCRRRKQGVSKEETPFLWNELPAVNCENF
jgi:hypothetical protein